MTRDEFTNELRGIAATSLFQQGIVDEDKVHDQMVWLGCLYEATVLLDSCNLRDVAHIVRNGMTAFDLNEWIEGMDLDDDEDANNILTTVRAF